jgi:hypothetical protein
MSQHDFNITADDANTGVEYRAAVNAAMQALASLSFGPTLPTVTYPCQLAVNAATHRVMMRDEANTTWGYAKDLFFRMGTSNNAMGVNALVCITTGTENTAVGDEALGQITTGNFNTSIGYLAGRYNNSFIDNSTSSSCVFLGAETKSLNPNSTNEIVIGYGAVGNGSNTATIGNTSTLRTVLNAGNLNIKAPAVPASATAAGVKGDIAYDAGYVYVCVDTNTWKRAALSSW